MVSSLCCLKDKLLSCAITTLYWLTSNCLLLQMKSLLVLLALSVFLGSMCTDAFAIWMSRRHGSQAKPSLHRMRQLLQPYTEDDDDDALNSYLTYRSKLSTAASKRSIYVRDPLWRPCLRMCYAGCSAWEDAHIKYCAEQCMKWGLDQFQADNYCFDIGQL